jgi:hypothetical protein
MEKKLYLVKVVLFVMAENESKSLDFGLLVDVVEKRKPSD